MGYPPDWQRDGEKKAVEKWLEEHPGFPWPEGTTENEKANWILSIPNNGPLPGVMWEEYDLWAFSKLLHESVQGDGELPINDVARIRATPPDECGRRRIVLEILHDSRWLEAWGQMWTGTPFTPEYAMQDIPKRLLIESQMVDPAFLKRFHWGNTPLTERYKAQIAKAAGTCAWACQWLLTETKGVVAIGADIQPQIDRRGVCTGFSVSLKVAEQKAGYVIKYNWGPSLAVGPDGKPLKEE